MIDVGPLEEQVKATSGEAKFIYTLLWYGL